MSQYQEKATVTRVEQFSDVLYRLTFDSPLITANAKPGQFVMVRTGLGKDPLLRRPFSIHQANKDGRLQLYFKVVGRGTDILSRVKEGETVSIFGPLGNGFRIDPLTPSVIVGGGLGIAPLLFLVKENCRAKKVIADDIILLGARQKVELEPLLHDFKQFGISILTATDDGSHGHHGFITEVFDSLTFRSGTKVYCCGPEPMMDGVRALCKPRGLACQVSVESVMACGMGACLGCSKPAINGNYTHVCVNGPVYDAEELVWNT
ncbi:MAG: dihydroorotate dehydrogenase electron transfer subunit [Desulforhopalus sp.]